uniref:Thioredoxin domain-containing protein n=1 Tax=Romanomermis culicivorax TaxID=13658 RepID=A0A915IJY2_ROMCU
MFSRFALPASVSGNCLLPTKFITKVKSLIIKRNITMTRRLLVEEQKPLQHPKIVGFFDKFAKRAPINLINMGVGVVMCGVVIEREADRKRQLGKGLIGGPWELVNHDGKLMSWKDFVGKWTLIYFGFTHCPDVCPDEIEKMVKVLSQVEERSIKDSPVEIQGLFFTVDPERDTPEKVKTYITEFSPKLMGFTGSKEQVEKVCKTFRVYFSQGPKDQFADYIVDHTIIIYLVDPDGNFVDYYGQRTSVDEMANAIQVLDQKFKYQKKEESGELTFVDRFKMNKINRAAA